MLRLSRIMVAVHHILLFYVSPSMLGGDLFDDEGFDVERMTERDAFAGSGELDSFSSSGMRVACSIFFMSLHKLCT